MPTALITGVSGQDGSYLAEWLVSKGYSVIGTTRDIAATRRLSYARAFDRVELVQLGLDSRVAIGELLARFQPDEVYHLAGPSRVGASWNDPAGTMLGIVVPTTLLLESIATEAPAVRCFVAGSCDTFAAEEHAQDESAPRKPVSPYGRAKLEAEEIVRRYRQEYGLFAVTGILFNHESPRRDVSFVSRKIARAATRIARGQEKTVTLGSVHVRRDWGFAGDYVRAMWLMLQQPDALDLVIGTGEAHSISDFYELAFRRVGLEGKNHVEVDPTLIRPGDAPLRLANPARARSRLGWTPEVDFERLVAMMVDYEMNNWGQTPIV
jgi:GDPmannose 4,6-dehydratase